VAYDIPALRDAYGGCEAVFLCKKGDVQKLAETILKILSLSPSDYDILSNIAKSYIKEKYSWNAIMSKERDIYYYIIASSK